MTDEKHTPDKGEVQEAASTGSAQEAQEAASADNAQEVQEAAGAAEYDADYEAHFADVPDAVKGMWEAETITRAVMGKIEEYAGKKDANDILGTATGISFLMDYLRSPEDALIDWGTFEQNPKIARHVLTARALRLVREVAEETGAPVEQIADPKKRTPEQEKALQEVSGREQVKLLNAFMDSNFMQALTEIVDLQNTAKMGKEAADSMRNYTVIYFFALHWPDIKPYSAASLTGQQLDEIRGIFARFDKFIAENPGVPVEEHFRKFVEKDSTEPDTVKKNIPYIVGGVPENVIFPIDKVNNTVWDKLDPEKADEKGNYYLAVGKPNKKKGIEKNSAFIEYSIFWNAIEERAKRGEIEITTTLTPFDKRVYIAVYSIYRQQGLVMSAGQIYAEMGKDSAPNTKDLQKILASLRRMAAARVYISNETEHKLYEGKPLVRIKNKPLLSFTSDTAYINGGLCDSAIFLGIDSATGQPPFPLMDFALDRGQYTTIPRKVFNGPLSLTDSNITLEDYLLEQIAAMKRNPEYSRKMTFASICEHCNITDRKQKQRTREKVTRELEHYKKCGQIAGWKQEDEKSVTVIIPGQQKAPRR